LSLPSLNSKGNKPANHRNKVTRFQIFLMSLGLVDANIWWSRIQARITNVFG